MADEPKKEELDLGKHPQFLAMMGALSKLSESLGRIDTTMAALGGRLVTLENGGGSSKESDSDSGSKDLSMDLETMDRSQFAEHMSKNLLQIIRKEMFEPLSEQIKGTQGRIGKMSAQDELSGMVEKHKDFADWREAMSQRLKGNEQLSLEDAYKLARADDPKKAAELDAKYNPKPKTFDATLGFYGFGDSASTDAKSGKMDAKQAAEAAWSETMANLPLPTATQQ